MTWSCFSLSRKTWQAISKSGPCLGVVLSPNGPKKLLQRQSTLLITLTSLQADKYRSLDGSVTVFPDVSIYTVAAGRLDSAAICPRTAVMLNAVKLRYFPVMLHSASNKPKLPGIKCNSTVCKQSFGYYCSAAKRCSRRWKHRQGRIKKFGRHGFSFCSHKGIRLLFEVGSLSHPSHHSHFFPLIVGDAFCVYGVKHTSGPHVSEFVINPRDLALAQCWDSSPTSGSLIEKLLVVDLSETVLVSGCAAVLYIVCFL